MIEPDFEPFATPRTAEKDQELARDGWSRRFVGGPPRLRELQELYESLGHEVRLERLSAEELAQECGDCRLALELFRVVYTRRLRALDEDASPSTRPLPSRPPGERRSG